MNYLLLGNGPIKDIARASDAADSIVQMNNCRHASREITAKTHHIFITNLGAKVSAPLCHAIKSHGALLGNATVVLGRNPLFYSSKRAYLQAQNWRAPFEDYQLTQAWRSLSQDWPVERVSLLSSMRLEYQLRRLGMHYTAMPSTGMIAYDWLLRKLKPDDILTVAGFTFEGWSGHPWKIESQLIRSVGIRE